MSFDDQVYDIEAERLTLAAMMLHPSAVETAAEILDEECFYRPSHQILFHTLVLMMAADEKIDAVTVTQRIIENGEIKAFGGNGIYIAELVGLQVVPEWAVTYGRIVLKYAVRRSLVGVGQRLITDAMAGDVDEVTMVGRAQLRLDRVLECGTVGAALPAMNSDEFCDSPEIVSVPLIPYLLNSQERVMVVGPEGGGKSILGFQVGYAAAAGVHPFQHQVDIEPCRVLVIDLENPQDIVQRRVRTFRSIAHDYPKWDVNNLTICHKPGGMNLTSPRDAWALAQLIKRTKAQLVVAGPVYKMIWGVKADLEAYALLAAFWDRMREDHGVALWLENHAPYGEPGRREFRPEGTNLWAKWVEFGVSLNWARKAHGGGKNLEWSWFKGQRDEHRDWPDWITRSPTPGTGWPWVANYESGNQPRNRRAA